MGRLKQRWNDMRGQAGTRWALEPAVWLQLLWAPLHPVPWLGRERMPFNTLCGFSRSLLFPWSLLSLALFPPWLVPMTLLSESFPGSSAKGSRGYCILSAAHESRPLTASALQIFIDIIMPPLAIIYPSSNSTSLSILSHQSTPPAPVIISLLLSELSKAWQHLNKVPQMEGSSLPGSKSNYLCIREMAYAKNSPWPCQWHRRVHAHFSHVVTFSLHNILSAIATHVPFSAYCPWSHKKEWGKGFLCLSSSPVHTFSI